ncbi:MAG TPA: AAA family ATPase [Armatimonadota bacterium]|nr:AAA family ATPase [Armatimonadota bacterium]
MDPAVQALQAKVEAQSAFVTDIREEVGKVIVGQSALVDGLIMGLLADGHVLLEGVPGLAKTLAVRTLAQVIDTGFQRIQFTPDLLPADIIGTMIYNEADRDFYAKKGPIFSNLILADEINRAPAKVQSALLEAMQERQVTLGDTTFPLATPFLVLATQNPIEQEGTYPLPEAQVDRFMLKLQIDYPSPDEELQILERMTVGHDPSASAKVSPDRILQARETVYQIYIDPKVERYIVNLVVATRKPEEYGLPGLSGLIRYGASPRATIYTTVAAKAFAFINGDAYVTPDHVRSVVHEVFRHRVIVSYEAEAEERTSDDIISEILRTVEVP